MEKKFTKELDATKTELETLKGELKVRMMKVQLRELELDNALKEVEEKEEASEAKFAEKIQELKRLQNEKYKDKKLISLLTEKKKELQQKVKDLTKMLEDGS